MTGKIFHTILIPSRPQVDTIVGVFLLKMFATDRYPGIEDAIVKVQSRLPEGSTEESLAAEGIVLVDVGGGIFDHHVHGGTTTEIIMKHLGLDDNPALQKIKDFIDRDDKYGKGIVSTDVLDKAFGLPGLVTSLNKSLPDDPNQVVQYVIPLLWGHYSEEYQREIGMPQEFTELESEGKIKRALARHKKKKVTIIGLQSDNPSISGWLRSRLREKADVVVQQGSSGHITIVTYQPKRIVLSSVAELVRREELMQKGEENLIQKLSSEKLSQTGTVSEVPEWYYDPMTKSLLNGGWDKNNTEATKISLERMMSLVEEGLNSI